MSSWAASRGLGIARPLLEPIWAFLRRKANRWLQRRSAILAYLGRDFWAQDKVWRAGCGGDRSCQACGAEVGCQHHRFCRCPNREAARAA
eukprot:7029674-Pyramimonas_sp.AAC.1